MTPEPSEPFPERIERLQHELAEALRWNRPSILLVVYSSEFVRADAEAALAAWLSAQGQRAARVKVAGPDDPTADIPQLLREFPERERTVFFVSGLRRGAPTTWKALNVRREYFVEDCTRAVFWLTEGEAAELPIRAPDFWVFRHRVVEFLEPPETARAAHMAERFAWEGVEERLPPKERQARIAFREQLLAELPDGPETAAARAELHDTTGLLYLAGRERGAREQHFEAAILAYRQAIEQDEKGFYWHRLGHVYDELGRLDEAVAAFHKAIELDPGDAGHRDCLGDVYRGLGRYEDAIAEYRQAIELDPQYAAPHDDLGDVYRGLGRYEEAIAEYRQAIELDPQYAASHNNLGNVYNDLGRYEEAIAAYRRASELDPQNAIPHNNLGSVYRDLGRYEEAIAEYRRASELDPQSANPHIGLAGVYRSLGNEQERQYHLAEARRLLQPDDFYDLACIEAIAGNNDAAVECLTRALEKRPGARAQAVRDPDFASIRDDPRFRKLVGMGETI